jgi:hypothetical protein
LRYEAPETVMIILRPIEGPDISTDVPFSEEELAEEIN